MHLALAQMQCPMCPQPHYPDQRTKQKAALLSTACLQLQRIQVVLRAEHRRPLPVLCPTLQMCCWTASGLCH
jgi:hypothetical protein